MDGLADVFGSLAKMNLKHVFIPDSPIGWASEILSTGAISIEAYIFLTTDYEENVAVLRYIRDMLSKHSTTTYNDEIIRIIDILIDEYTDKWTTTINNIKEEALQWTTEKLLDAFTYNVYSIVKFVGDVTLHISDADEKLERGAWFCLNPSLKDICLPVKDLCIQGRFTASLEEMDNSVDIYFHYLLYLNQIALKFVEDNAQREILQQDIIHIQNCLNVYF